MKFIMLTNIFTFITIINTSDNLKARKVFIFQYFSFQLRMKFIMLINILTFLSTINTTSDNLKSRKVFQVFMSTVEFKKSLIISRPGVLFLAHVVSKDSDQRLHFSVSRPLDA